MSALPMRCAARCMTRLCKFVDSVSEYQTPRRCVPLALGALALKRQACCSRHAAETIQALSNGSKRRGHPQADVNVTMERACQASSSTCGPPFDPGEMIRRRGRLTCQASCLATE